MSVTIFCPESPEVLGAEYECMICEGLEAPKPDCPFCKGTGKERFVDHSASLNVSNSNFEALFRLLEADETAECWQGQQIGTFRQRIMKLMNSSRQRASEVEEPFKIGSSWCEGGRSDDYLVRRLSQLNGLLAQAQENGWKVVWG
ncbi:MAG: hypothetical protein M0036_19150 [Desulfobacteraceae bacterium]|nr:hypothetical protein [Desulfobacteraceae bacterium]